MNIIFILIIQGLIFYIVNESLKLFGRYLHHRAIIMKAEAERAKDALFAYGASIHDAMLNGFVAGQAAAAVLNADEYFKHLEQLDWILNTNGITYHDE